MTREVTALRTLMREAQDLGNSLNAALHHLCQYLDGSTRADHEDEFGIQVPTRWEPWYTAHLFRTVVHFLEREQTNGKIDGELHRKLAASLADLAARLMYLQATPGAQKTMDAVVRGQLGE